MKTASRSIGHGRAGESLADLRELCRACAHNYVSLVDAESVRPGDRLNVFNAVSDAFDCHVTESRMVMLGINALIAWSTDALERSGTNGEPLRILERRLDRLDEMRVHIEAQGSQRSALAEWMSDAEWRIRDRIRGSKRR